MGNRSVQYWEGVYARTWGIGLVVRHRLACGDGWYLVVTLPDGGVRRIEDAAAARTLLVEVRARERKENQHGV